MLKASSLLQPLLLLFFFIIFDTFFLLDAFHLLTTAVAPTPAFLPPCPNSTVPFDNDTNKTANGCGSLAWQIAAGKVVYPFTKFFGQCCARHDTCFDTCGGPEYLKHYERCNQEFRECLREQCETVSSRSDGMVSRVVGKVVGKVVRKRCEKNGMALVKMLNMSGVKAFQRSQNEHCGCKVV